MENVEKRFEDHMTSDERNFDRIATVLESLTSIHERIARIESDLDWLKRWYWLVVSSGVTGLVSGIGALVMVILKK